MREVWTRVLRSCLSGEVSSWIDRDGTVVKKFEAGMSFDDFTKEFFSTFKRSKTARSRFSFVDEADFQLLFSYPCNAAAMAMRASINELYPEKIPAPT